MPLAFTQEDFLVQSNFTASLDINDYWSPVYCFKTFWGYYTNTMTFSTNICIIKFELINILSKI